MNEKNEIENELSEYEIKKAEYSHIMEELSDKQGNLRQINLELSTNRDELKAVVARIANAKS